MITRLRAFAYRLLRRSEQWTKTDMIYFAKSVSWLTLGNGISSVVVFLVAIAYANWLPRETYGTYRYILSIASILGIISLRGHYTAVVQAVARGYEGTLQAANRARLAWSSIGSGVAILIALYYQWLHNYPLAVGMVLVALFLPWLESFTTFDALLQGRKNFSASARYQIIGRLINGTLTIITLFLTDNLYIVTLTYLVSWAGIRLFQHWYVMRHHQPNNLVDAPSLRFGFHLSINGVISSIANYLDQLLIFNLLGPIQLAVYSFALKPADQLKSILRLVGDVALPKFASKKQQNVGAQILKKALLFGAAIAVIVAIYIIAAPWLFTLFFPQYQDATFYSQLIAISLLSSPLFLIISYFQSRKMLKEIYTFNTSVAVIQIAMTLILIPLYGVFGAVIAKLLSRFVNLAVSLILVKRAISTPDDAARDA